MELARRNNRAVLLIELRAALVNVLTAAGITARRGPRGNVAPAEVATSLAPAIVPAVAGALLAFLELPEVRYQTAEQRNRFQVELLRRIRALPGVVSAAIGPPPPRSSGSPVNVETAGEPGAESWRVDFKYSSDRYFETLGIPLLQGRAISEEDMDHARKVAVINRAFVTKYFGGKSPVGRHHRRHVKSPPNRSNTKTSI